MPIYTYSYANTNANTYQYKYSCICNMFSFVHLQTCPCNSGCIHSFNHSIMGLCSRSSVHSSCQFISFHLVIHSFARSVLATHFWTCSNYYAVSIAYICSLSYSCTNVLLLFYLMFIPLLIRSLTCWHAVDPCVYVLFNYMHKIIYIIYDIRSCT